MTCTFDEAMERRLRTSKTEATREVLALVKTEDMYVGDAIALVIESMPRQKTAQLRRWNDDWEGWCEWLEWKDQGWESRQISSGIGSLIAPYRHGFDAKSDRPSDVAAAAAMDAVSARFLGVGHYSTRQPK